MPSIELTRVAGNVVDVLSTLGYSSEQIMDIAKLMEKHAAIRDKYEEEAARPPSLVNTAN
ncbi:MAG: hypothetical protein RBU21_16255 [FCB group bacterium]|jgi:hypothetical protein|nr:hypothetical protein [FCB group bacterium]